MTWSRVGEMAMIPQLRIIHRLPGRVRIKMSILPKTPDQMMKTVRTHSGILEMKLTPITQTLLLKYEPGKITQEELIIRVAVYLSLENDFCPIRIFSDIEVKELSNIAFLSGSLIVAAFGGRLFKQLGRIHRLLDWTAGVSTAYSILDHAHGELKDRGNFDPEVLSIIYLLTAFMQGNLLPASLFTWIATFGRHLLEMSSKNVEITPREVRDGKMKDPHYEVIVKPINRLPGKQMVFKFLPTIIMQMAMGDSSRVLQGTLLDEIKKVSHDHGEILEGFGKLQDGMPIRIQYSN